MTTVVKIEFACQAGKHLLKDPLHPVPATVVARMHKTTTDAKYPWYLCSDCANETVGWCDWPAWIIVRHLTPTYKIVKGEKLCTT